MSLAIVKSGTSVYANGLFAGVNNSVPAQVLKAGDKARFVGVFAQTGAAGTTLSAGFAIGGAGAARVDLTKSDIAALLDELKKPAHKVAVGNGQTVTKYPGLVIALKQAEKDIDLYSRPEMIAYLERDKTPKVTATHLRVAK